MPLPRVLVRAATRADIDALVAARAALFREIGVVHAEEEARFLPVCRAAYEALLDEDASFARIVDSEAGELAATLTVLAHPRLPTPALAGTMEGYVVGVYTRPASRGLGLASAVLRAAIEESRRRGFARLRLHTTEAGRRIYAANGFRPRADEMEFVL